LIRPLIKSAAAALLLACSPVIVFAANDLQVKTDHGKVEGKLAADGKVRVFLGIPYAAPPVGNLRWRAPQPPAKWKDVKSVTAYGPRCMQPALYADMVFHDPGNSEDCLSLNVWTPAPAKSAKNAKLPVMVWIYGGGFITGSTSEMRQDGEFLAQKGVVVVSMNYRLGVFGFFAHHGLAAENPQHAAGNYGLMDQAAALAWVKHNIEAFGGDPGNVTLFGESAGSFSVSAQMASPLSKDLIQRAIGESGGAFSQGVISFPALEFAEKRDEAFAEANLGTSDLTALRAMPADKLLAAANIKGEEVPRFEPDVDGYFLPESVPAIFAAGKQAHIPLLAGWNMDEGTAMVVNAPEKPSAQTLQTMAQKEYGADAGDFLKAYSASTDDEALRVAEDYAGDRFIAYSTWAWLEAQVKTGGAPVYRYRFDRPSPGDPNHSASSGAFHSDEIEYVFGVLDSRKGAAWSPEDYKLSALIQSYWTNFAKSGNPNGSGVPDWPVYSEAANWPVMHLDVTPVVRPDRHRDRYLFLQNWGRKQHSNAAN
jgi:para-nitrobenzyl esterase